LSYFCKLAKITEPKIINAIAKIFVKVKDSPVKIIPNIVAITIEPPIIIGAPIEIESPLE